MSGPLTPRAPDALSLRGRRRRRLWLLAGVVAAVVGLAVAVWFSEAGQLRYHAWRYRSGRDRDRASLKLLTRWAVETRADRASIIRRLGTPDISTPGRMLYCPRPASTATPEDIVYLLVLDQRGCAEHLEADPARKPR